MKTDTVLKELAERTRVSGLRVFQILQQDLKMHNIGCAMRNVVLVWNDLIAKMIMLNCVFAIDKMLARPCEIKFRR
jgi:hypothetical protein